MFIYCANKYIQDIFLLLGLRVWWGFKCCMICVTLWSYFLWFRCMGFLWNYPVYYGIYHWLVCIPYIDTIGLQVSIVMYKKLVYMNIGVPCWNRIIKMWTTWMLESRYNYISIIGGSLVSTDSCGVPFIHSVRIFCDHTYSFVVGIELVWCGMCFQRFKRNN